MNIKEALAQSLRGFHLPRYREIPDVGLYLEQTVKYINQWIQPLGYSELTGSMVRNYVKQGLISNPVHKQYAAEQIIHLITIALLKQVIPLEHISNLFIWQKEVYTDQVAYDYFCEELENILFYRFGLKDTMEDIGVTSSIEKEMLRSAIVAISHIAYLNACIDIVDQKDESEKFCDLHTHSWYSDGTDAPMAVVEKAAKMGLEAVALTDHNTVEGLPEFLKTAKKYGIEAIPGVEISTGYKDKEVHIIGLFIDPKKYDVVSEYVSVINHRKEESNQILIENLAQDGYILDLEEIREKKQGTINRAVIAAALLDKGYVGSIEEAFKRLLKKEHGYFIPPERIPSMEAIAFLRSIQAIPVLAHPLLSLTEEELQEFLPEAKVHGLLAMETRYSKYTEEMTEKAMGLSQDYELLESGGSDYHGDNKPDIQLGKGTGTLKVPADIVKKLKKCRNH